MVYKESSDIVALSIDLKSKYCEIGSSISSSKRECGITIDTNEHSLYLHPEKDRDNFTEIYFTEYVGWSYWGGSSGRYTITLCLIKENSL